MEPVRKEIVVEAPPERAFRVFTSGFDKWWPREHHLQEASMAKAVMETHAGGRWYEVGTDGSQCDWGKVLIWDPPKRIVLSWQINSQWQYDPQLHTEVEVRFVPAGELRTRVEFEHRLIERMGEKAAATRAELDSPGGWLMHLTLFAAEAASDSVPAPH